MICKSVLDSLEDTQGIQIVKVSLLQNETQEMERYQDYGFTSVPPQDSEGVCIFVGGNRENGVCIRMDNREFRLKNLGAGHVALYDKQGSKVHLKANGEIVIEGDNIKFGEAATEKILKGETFQAFFNAHTHTGNLGAPTGPPNVLSNAAQLSSKVKSV
jgi:phage baseplate assembly protein V